MACFWTSVFIIYGLETRWSGMLIKWIGITSQAHAGQLICPLLIADGNRGRDHCWQDVHSRPVLGGDGRRGEGPLLLGHPARGDMNHTAAEGIYWCVKKHKCLSVVVSHI